MVKNTDKRVLGVGESIGIGLSRLKRLTAYVHAQSGADSSGFMLLNVLANCGPSRSSALAEAVHADPSTVSRQVAQLVKDGLVQRQADNGDGRAIVLAITDSGREALRRSFERRSALLADALADWPEEDQTRFAELFTRFIDDYERRLPVLIAEYASENNAVRGK